MDAKRAQVWELLRSELPDLDVVLTGRDEILAHLWRMGVRTWSGRVPRWSTVLRWARRDDFPLLRGTRAGRNYFSSLTSQHAVTAWLLSRERNGRPMRVFRRRQEEPAPLDPSPD